MSFEYPIEALKTEVEGLLSAAGDTVAHLFGARFIETTKAAPYYIWIPMGASPIGKAAATRAVDEDRTLFLVREDFTVVVRGRSFAEVFAMRTNLMRALQMSAFVDITPQASKWVRPGAGFNQDGEAFELQCSLAVPMVDAFVDLSTLADPVVDTIIPSTIEGTLELSPDVDTAGEVGLVVEVP